MTASAFIQSFSKIVPGKTNEFYETVDSILQLAVKNVKSSNAYQTNLDHASTDLSTDKKNNSERFVNWKAGMVNRDSVISYIGGHPSDEAQTLAETLKVTERHDPKRSPYALPCLDTRQYGISTPMSVQAAEIVAKEAASAAMWASFRVNLQQIEGTEVVLLQAAGMKPATA